MLHASVVCTELRVHIAITFDYYFELHIAIIFDIIKDILRLAVCLI